MTQPSAAAAGTVAIGDLTVNRLGFGAMRLTGDGIWGEPADPAACKAVLRRVLELGIDVMDTADAYGPEVSERLIAETLHPYPAGLLVTTKGGLVRPGPGIWDPDGRPEHLRSACEASLRRLRVDAIDLYQLHTARDPHVPYAESVGAIAELLAEGKIRRVGVSNVSLAQLRVAQEIVPVATVQNRFSVDHRVGEEVLEACEADGIAFIPWFPLGSGGLARPDGPLAGVAADCGATPSQVALAWLLERSPAMLPIPGTAKVAHLEENVAAASLRLGPAELAAIEAAVAA